MTEQRRQNLFDLDLHARVGVQELTLAERHVLENSGIDNIKKVKETNN